MNRRKQKSPLPLISAVIVLCLAAICGMLVMLFFTWAAGGLRPRNAEFLDLRGKDISLSAYRDACEKLPDCEILWDVPFQGERISSDAEELSVTALTREDISLLAFFPKLASMDARGCRDYDLLEEIRQTRPEIAILSDVRLGDTDYPCDAERISADSVPIEDLRSALALLPNLKTAELTGVLPSSEALRALLTDYPAVTFRYQVPFDGKSIPGDAQTLDISGKMLTYADAEQLIGLLPGLRSADMTGCSLTDAEMLALAAAYPECRFLWDVTVAGLTFPSDSVEIDLSGQTVENTQQVEAMLPAFPDLQRVIMCGCGPDNETMDALNRKYPDIRFVWSIYVQNAEIRTDAEWFYPFKYKRDMVVTDSDLYPLRYCTDMVAIDIGHMTTVTSCEWAAFMPKLRYLIIVETAITDISPLANLKNLVFLEIFTTKITDYSPLLQCTALEDLNLGNTYGDEEPILQMTWLKNLWWSGIEGTQGLPCSDAPDKLRQALPDTRMKFNLVTPNVDNGWRQLQHYYEMRDIMDVFYLT